MESKEERWGNETGCVKLVGSTCQLWAISWWEELNRDNKNHIFEVRGISHWMKSLFGFTTWCCLDMLLAKLFILPATSSKFKQGKTPKNPMWIMVNKALLQPPAHFNHHKLLKSHFSISPSIRQAHSTQGWPQNKKQLLKPLLVLMAGGTLPWIHWQAHCSSLSQGMFFTQTDVFIYLLMFSFWS